MDSVEMSPVNLRDYLGMGEEKSGVELGSIPKKQIFLGTQSRHVKLIID